MGEFRIGRKKAKHFYPERRHGSALFLFARNFATGPKVGTAIAAAGTQLPWNAIDVSPGPADEDVPITPISSGKILLDGDIVVGNADGVTRFVTIQIQVNDVTLLIPAANHVSVEAGGFLSIPILAELTLPVGVTANIQILATAEVDGQLTFSQLSSSLSLEEVNAATG